MEQASRTHAVTGNRPDRRWDAGPIWVPLRRGAPDSKSERGR